MPLPLWRLGAGRAPGCGSVLLYVLAAAESEEAEKELASALASRSRNSTMRLCGGCPTASDLTLAIQKRRLHGGPQHQLHLHC